MGFRIVWSEFAETQLDQIYDYYEKIASSRIASKLVKGIIKSPQILLKAPNAGQEEGLLQEREIHYRYLFIKIIS